MRKVALLFLLLAGCIAYVPKPIDATANARALQARRLEEPAVREFVEKSLGRTYAAWPPPAWDLETLTAAALLLNPEIAVARSEYAETVAAIATARERPNPILNATVEKKSQTVESSPWISMFGFDLPIELPAKRRGRIAQAIETAEATRARISGVGWDVRSRLRARMIDVYGANERESVLRRQETAQNDIVEIFTKRVEFGEAAQLELSRARIAVVQTRMLLDDVARAREEGRAGVTTTAGVPQQPMVLDFTAFTRPPSTIDEHLRDEALVGRAGVIAALHEYAATEAALRLEIARQFPDVHFAPAFGWDQGARAWTLGASAELPIFNQHRGAIGEATARRDVAAARFNALQASVIGAFELARAQVDAARRKLADAEALARSEDAQSTTVRKQFEAGEIDRLALRTTELEREAAELARVDAAIDLQRAIGAMEDVVQRPLQPKP